ncbi:hypothetical protein [Hymenobacter koreensis]|uniref:hypothetical protein n=1 Tax=Hymenobacter koreensis TaxID=1084523 RepID=UPI0031E913E1
MTASLGTSFAAHAQTPTDSLPRRFNILGEPHLVPRVGVALQKQMAVEVGLIRHRVRYQTLGNSSRGLYAAADIVPGRRLVVGPKVGGSFGANAASADISLVYYTDFKRRQLMLTPAVGVGLIGFANLLYGYNIPLTGRQLTEVGGHRVSLVGNLNFRAPKEYDQLVESRRR